MPVSIQTKSRHSEPTRKVARLTWQVKLKLSTKRCHCYLVEVKCRHFHAVQVSVKTFLTLSLSYGYTTWTNWIESADLGKENQA